MTAAVRVEKSRKDISHDSAGFPVVAQKPVRPGAAGVVEAKAGKSGAPAVGHLPGRPSGHGLFSTH
ncbi:hypothetical protein C4K16_3195 [Pseudomonas chlororaphis subsp. aurantiaca]|nr:hypothetical protein C4K17_3195 [Pseudomonas chlororaphis subsp. aurantiaca]AZD73555.1 hypothetical protein C4K16_3195 [Pseudomonas chlororaphis subsp. aurantiaca]